MPFYRFEQKPEIWEDFVIKSSSAPVQTVSMVAVIFFKDVFDSVSGKLGGKSAEAARFIARALLRELDEQVPEA